MTRRFPFRFFSTSRTGGLEPRSTLDRWLEGWLATPPAQSLLHSDPLPTGIPRLFHSDTTSTLTMTLTLFDAAIAWAQRQGPVAHLSRSLLHRLFRHQDVRCFDPETGQVKRIKSDTVLHTGAQLLFPKKTIEQLATTSHRDTKMLSSSSPPRPSASIIRQIQDSIIAEYDACIAINKPSGLAVQGGTNVSVSIDAILPFLSTSTSTNDSTRSTTLRLVHRLDKDVTGVLLLAKGSQHAAQLGAAFKNASLGSSNSTSGKPNSVPYIRKKYWALVVPRKKPEETEEKESNYKLEKKGDSGTIITSSSVPNQQQQQQQKITKYRVLGKNDSVVWLELEPVTGRKHQLRQHCAHVLNAPILGDVRYAPVRTDPIQQRLLGLQLQKEEGTNNHEEEELGREKNERRMFLHCRSIQVALLKSEDRPPKQQKKHAMVHHTITAAVPIHWQHQLRIHFSFQEYR